MSKKKDFERIGIILDKTIKNLGLEHRMKEERILQIWPDIVGEEISKHTRPLYIHKGTLFVGVDNPIWSNEVSLLKEEIKERLNQKTKKEVVKGICLKMRRRNVSPYRLSDYNSKRFN